MIKIYGSPQSSAGRCFWCLEEVGAKYEQIPVSFKDKEHKSEAYLKINPTGKVPTLVDGDFNVWESMAINFYLANAYKPEILGKDVKEKALVHQWSFWAINELQPPMVEILIQKVFVPEERRDLDKISAAEEKIKPLLKVLNDSMNKTFIASNDFTLADINLASVVNIAMMIRLDLAEFPQVGQWLSRVSERPSFQKYMELCK